MTLTTLAGNAPAIPQPPFTAIAGGDAKTPSQLTMRVVHAERSRNPLPLDGPHAPFREEFMNADGLAARYTVYTATGKSAPTSETIAKGKLTMVGSGASASSRIYRSHTKLLVGTGVFTAVRVEPGTTPTTGGTVSQAIAGFARDTAGGGQIGTYYQPSDGKIAFVNTIGSISGASVVTVPELVNPTKTVWVACILDYPYIFAMYSLDGENWQEATVGSITTPNMYDSAIWSTFRPMAQLQTDTSGTIAISKIVAGYVGSYGYRDQKVITYADGTPVRRHGKYWLTGTVAHGGPNFRTNSMAIYSFDPDTYRVELVRHLYYDLYGTGIGAGYGGSMAYDEATGTWHILANSWGFDDANSGVALIYGTTGKDLLTPGSSLIKARRLALGPNAGYYDSAIRREAGVWQVVITTDNTSYGPQLYTGTRLDALTLAAADNAHANFDGTNWAKIGGTWYVVAGGATFAKWNSDLTGYQSLTSWSSDAKVAALVPLAGGFPAHPCIVPVDDEYQTRYCMVTYDLSFIDGQGSSRGGLAVLEADEKPAGQEFQSKANTYFGY